MKRATRQRAVISKILAGAGRPLSPPEVLAAGQEELPRLGIATVYRTLNLLVEEDMARVVEVPGQTGRYYEVANLARHDHFFCNRCHRVFDVEPARRDPARSLPRGFTVEHEETVYSGRCPTCRDDG